MRLLMTHGIKLIKLTNDSLRVTNPVLIEYKVEGLTSDTNILWIILIDDIAINIARIASRVQSGGHSVPEEKVVARSMRALGNVGAALPFCSRAFFFDNSMLEMRFLAEYSKESGFVSVSDNLPSWFKTHVLNTKS